MTTTVTSVALCRNGIPSASAARRRDPGLEIVADKRWILARLRNARFFSLAELNIAIRTLVDELNARLMRKLGASRREFFDTIDRPALMPLPAEPYQYAEWRRARVAPDYHVEVAGHFYSVPSRMIRQVVEVRATEATIEVFHRGKRYVRAVHGDGQYGAGTVMVWDKGAYDTKDGVPPNKQLARGKLDVELHGAKLRGGFTLVRTGKRSVDPAGKDQWLLIKHRDEYADPAWDIEDRRFDRSVLTGRSMKEIERAGSDTMLRRRLASMNQVKG